MAVKKDVDTKKEQALMMQSNKLKNNLEKVQ